jgi:hypothetical protein
MIFIKDDNNMFSITNIMKLTPSLKFFKSSIIKNVFIDCYKILQNIPPELQIQFRNKFIQIKTMIII